MKAIIFFSTIVLFQPLVATEAPAVRKSTKNLSHREWQRYRRAVELMKEISRRNSTDPRGFIFQSNVHGWPGYDASPQADEIVERYSWHQAQHKQAFFLVWHRMYLYFYEKIMRKLINDPLFAIPYWDYADPTQLSIPEPYRYPQDRRVNTFFVAERCPKFNNGFPLHPEFINPLQGLLANKYTTTKRLYERNVCHVMDGALTEPQFDAGLEGLVENIPHDNVHQLIGGNGGYMINLCLSGLDPIFFNHHVMIDRIWESWSRAGGQSNVDQRFLRQTFDFFDENGKRVTARVADFMSMDGLGYVYESLIDVKSDESVDKDNEVVMDDMGYDWPKQHISVDNSDSSELSVSAGRQTLTLKVNPEFRNRFKVLAKNQVKNLRSTLRLEYKSLVQNIYFHIYLNIPPMHLALDASPYLIGFAQDPSTPCVPLHNISRPQTLACLDVSDNLQQVLQNSLHYTGSVADTINLTFIPKTCDDEVLSVDDSTWIVFSRIILMHFFY